jgi:hypothetical protein
MYFGKVEVAMDIGIFKASGRRLKAWLIIPPLCIVSLGLGSYAWQQQSHWRLEQTKALSEVLPPFITAQKEALALAESLKASSSGNLGSEDQLISFLQDMAQQNDFIVDRVSILAANKRQKKVVPVLNAVVRGEGDFTSIELYINQVKTEQRLLSVSSIKVLQPTEISVEELYNVEIVFELLLLDDLKIFKGGAQ